MSVAGKPDREADRAQTRLASIVIAVAMLLWLALSFLGGELGLAPRFAILLDMLCLAALGWALVTLFLVWRRRETDRGADKE
ncbi:DUF5337 domain-containing protein [Albimonas sp. CAU 1670]|uniref:DUF5337 domain-containing protein n=1 Tax=Albimonas sp. CAU 1670 TaxID=3032599 RepID=UPI0023DB2642|nr:DUF5337 domain-containing protein [Albimonas sp. CAU 1670]MDF2232683.1 DUF5337 domain-containing protein [Albimonas sp. CAU 1670]